MIRIGSIRGEALNEGGRLLAIRSVGASELVPTQQSLIMKNDLCIHQALRLGISPGGLLHAGESVVVSANGAGELVVREGARGGFAEIARMRLTADAAWTWRPEACGQYALEFTADAGGEVLRRPLAVVDRAWAVCQITVGAFTAEDFADLIHEARVAADYYVTLRSRAADGAFSAVDPRWRDYERLHGDAIHPHVMAKDVGAIASEFAHDDPNWESLPLAGIEARLRVLQAWWQAQGYAPLDRIATYTPCNVFTRACRAAGIRVVHSLCPEQNWSDGEWAINHWGMPTCPFWIAPDDFRKAGARDKHGVLGITMNHYQVLLPHLTHWGDFVLSPSHFTRWIRAVDSGDESSRFRQFLTDTIKGGSPLGEAPFFFVAGFEFGRTFGTANMTAYNRAGLSRLLALPKTENLVFVTSGDVRAYYDRHVARLPDRAFRQRDNWVGVTVNGKPGQAGDSVVIERGDYKALIREGAHLPFFYYDYRTRWEFPTADIHAPMDFAAALALELAVTPLSAGRLRLEARAPLTRATPFVVWDAEVDDSGLGEFVRLPLGALDDGRTVTLLEAPAGWTGRRELTLRIVGSERGTRRDDRWVMQTFGEGETMHTYLHLDAPLTGAVGVPVRLAKACVLDDAKQSLGAVPAGERVLEFGPLQGWYRFWGCGVADILPTEEIEAVLGKSGVLLAADAAEETRRHAAALDATAWSHPALRGKQRVISAHCGAALPLGTRSRAYAHDRVLPHQAGVNASEYADGVISFGPGRAFWYHPRGLHFRITGLKDGAETTDARWTVLLHSFDPQGLGAAYRVAVGPEKRAVGRWEVPVVAEAPEAFFPVEVTARDLDARGRVSFEIRSDQTSLIHWWKDGGFIAALHAFWAGRS